MKLGESDSTYHIKLPRFACRLARSASPIRAQGELGGKTIDFIK